MLPTFTIIYITNSGYISLYKLDKLANISKTIYIKLRKPLALSLYITTISLENIVLLLSLSY